MRIRLKGIHRVHKRLASGQNATYFYAWRGGPRLAGILGSHEFIAAFNDAVAGLVRRRTDKLDSILDGFQDSDAFLSLAPRTREELQEASALDSKCVWGFSTRRPDRPKGARRLSRMAGWPGRALAKASICMGRAGEGSILGTRPRSRRCQPMRERRQALSRLPRR